MQYQHITSYFSGLLGLLLLIHITLATDEDLNIHVHMTRDGVALNCGACDLSHCPLVSPDTCSGQILKDSCNCCPVCAPPLMDPSAPPQAASNDTELKCEQIKCPKNQLCVLNIQKIPICRCPSKFNCRLKSAKRDVCGENGVTYRSRCYLKIEECEQDKKIGVEHTGPCIGEEVATSTAPPPSPPPPKNKLNRKQQRKDKKKQMREELRRLRKIERMTLKKDRLSERDKTVVRPTRKGNKQKSNNDGYQLEPSFPVKNNKRQNNRNKDEKTKLKKKRRNKNRKSDRVIDRVKRRKIRQRIRRRERRAKDVLL